jgi:hypothetical protein
MMLLLQPRAVMMLLLQPRAVMMILLQPRAVDDDAVDVVIIAFMLTDVDVSGSNFML